MKVFNVKLQAMCTNKNGAYLWAHGDIRGAFAGPPMAHFHSISALQAACERIGVPCSEWWGPDSSIEWELSADELLNLGFKLRRGQVLDWPDEGSAHSRDSGNGSMGGPTPAA